MSDAASDSPRTWRPSPLLRFSAALHLAALLVTVVHPHWWPWTLAAVIADHLWLTAIGLWPRSTALGPNWITLPPAAAARGEVAITIDDGPDPAVTAQVLRILAQHDARVTFFVIAERAERHGLCIRECLAAGHAIENHSYRHSHNFSLLGPRGLRHEIGRAQDVLALLAGVRPRFFRAPAGLRNPFLDPVLQQLDLQLASWTRRGFDTVNTDPNVVLGRLIRNLKAGDILLLHDGHAAHGSSGQPVILEVLPGLLEAIARKSLRPVTLREAAR